MKQAANVMGWGIKGERGRFQRSPEIHFFYLVHSAMSFLLSYTDDNNSALVISPLQCYLETSPLIHETCG